MRLRAVALAGLAGCLGVSALHAQYGAAPAPVHWIISASVGLVSRENAPWNHIHRSIDSSGWDNDYPICGFLCPSGSDVAVGRPASFTLALRRDLHGHWQLRLAATSAPLGTYPGLSDSTMLRIDPSDAALSIQAAYAVKGFWVALGPAINLGRVRESAGASRQSSSRVMPGATFGAGLTFPSRSPVFVEFSFERHYTGSVTTPAMAVAGEPDVPALRVPVSNTVINVGVGLRR